MHKQDLKRAIVYACLTFASDTIRRRASISETPIGIPCNKLDCGQCMCRVCINMDAYETDKNPESFIRGLQETMASTKAAKD